ncbi:MAG TPA: hypothetical protein VMV49_10680 [Candidatus Deferrimicrobium sp.]|nr:hypothetical protein [Candidatus Deferrimicrobium sp.]
MEQEKDYYGLLKEAYEREDKNSFNQLMDEFIWLEWDEVPKIIQSFNVKKIARNVFFSTLFRSFFGDLAYAFFILPGILFSPLQELREEWRSHYEYFETFFENQSKRDAASFLYSSKLFFNIIQKNSQMYRGLGDLLRVPLFEDQKLTVKEYEAYISVTYGFLRKLFESVDEIFATQIEKVLEISLQKKAPLYDIVNTHIDAVLYKHILGQDYKIDENFLAISMNDKKPYAYSCKDLEREVYHGTILWEMFLHGYFRVYLSRLQIIIPTEVQTNPFKMMIRLCKETPKIYPYFAEYFSLKLQDASMIRI